MNADLFSFIFKRQAFHLGLGAKIQKESYLNFGGTQVMEQLRFMRRIERPTRFQFEQYDSINYEIGIIGADGLSMEPDWNGNLPLKIDAAFFKGHGHSLFINLFKKSKSEFIVNVVKNANDLFGQF